MAVGFVMHLREAGAEDLLANENEQGDSGAGAGQRREHLGTSGLQTQMKATASTMPNTLRAGNPRCGARPGANMKDTPSASMAAAISSALDRPGATSAQRQDPLGAGTQTSNGDRPGRDERQPSAQRAGTTPCS